MQLQKATKKIKGRYHTKGLIKSSAEHDPWPPFLVKSFITLALVHQKAQLRTKEDTYTAAKLHIKGGINKILGSKSSIRLHNMHQIFCSDSLDAQMSCDNMRILIEGHPGIGKTTLAKEICLQWANDKLLTSCKLVILLMLRDPKVQKISNTEEMVKYFLPGSQEQTIISYLDDTDGGGVTIIIDGFDELSEDLCNKSFFRELIEGDILPAAQLVVTSRPYASAVLHEYIQRRIEVLGFEKSSKEQYISDALNDSPSMLQKLKKHFQQNPSIDTICYIPLNLAIVVYLCLLGSFPSTATKLFSSFILHTICRHLKRTGKHEQLVNDIEKLPPSVKLVLQQLERIAFDGLVKDKIVFTIDDLPDVCKQDPTCYGLLQSVECYCSFEIGNPTKTFNFLHLGIQEYLAARYVTTLKDNEIHQLIKESFLVFQKRVSSKAVRLSNMWILYCGITKQTSMILQRFVDNEKAGNQQSDFPILEHNILYLFQCFQESHDNKMCDILVEQAFGQLVSPDHLVIGLTEKRLLPPHLVSLGFFLSKSYKWKELDLTESYIGDHGISILHNYLCKERFARQQILTIDFTSNDLTKASSCAICDIITHLQPHVVILRNNNVDLRKISIAVVSTPAVKGISLESTNLTPVVASEISNLMRCLMVLDISDNKLDEHAAVILAKSLKETKTLEILKINNNEIKAAGATEFADSLMHNNSLKVLYISGNDIGPVGATAIAKAIITNQTLQNLDLSNNKFGFDGAVALSEVIATTNALKELDIRNNDIGQDGATVIAKAFVKNQTLQSLYIGYNKLGSEGTIALSEVIAKNDTLEVLDISGWDIKLTGVEAISKATAENTSLKALLMHDIPICQDGATAIAEAINKNKTLEILALVGYDDMNLQSVITILESLCNNTSINQLFLIIPIKSHFRACNFEAKNYIIEKIVEKIKTKIAQIREACNKEMVELEVICCPNFSF